MNQSGFLQSLITDYGEATVNHGLLRVNTYQKVDLWTSLMRIFFHEEIRDFDLTGFAYNWQGVMCCVNSTNTTIVYLDSATCEYFEAEFTIEELFNEVFSGEGYDILFEEYFEEVKSHLKFENLKYDGSVGLIKYLHLVSADDKKNLEIVNTELLWELQIQIAENINSMSD